MTFLGFCPPGSEKSNSKEHACVLVVTPLVSIMNDQVDRAANNSRSSDNGPPKFANVRQNRNLGRTFCQANFLLQLLTKSFTNII